MKYESKEIVRRYQRVYSLETDSLSDLFFGRMKTYSLCIQLFKLLWHVSYWSSSIQEVSSVSSGL
jgi:hypothetical protein